MPEPGIFLSAGEASGDLHGAELAAELRRRRPDVRLYGLGGSRMAEAGVELLADLDRLAVLGFAEVVTHIPDLVLLRRDVHRFIRRERIDLLVPIDYPGFNLALARFAHDRGTKVVYYIAPQVWAWHPSRARRLAEVADLVCVVLPFEQEFLEKYGARVSFVGHPLLDRRREEHRAVASGPVLGLFPGSRAQEVRRMLPPFMAAAALLRSRDPSLRVCIACARDLPPSVYSQSEGADLASPEEVAARATAALTKSGTTTLQLAIAGVPMVVAYRMNPATFLVARRLVSIEHIALANLVAGRRLVPELVQDEVTPHALAAAVAPLLDLEGSERAGVVAGLTEVVRRLGEPGATERVANACLQLLDGVA